MARLRQQYPQNYRASGNISAEFESVIRYLNAAEMGNFTLAELLSVLFDDTGTFVGPIELRRNLDGDLEYRVGSYDAPEQGWVVLAAASDLRGPAGIDAGEIGAPIMHSRHDVQPTNGQTVVAYAHTATDAVLAFIDGILLREGAGYDYVTNPVAGTVTFSTPLTSAQTVTLYKIRKSAITGYTRKDYETTAPQVVFPFIHDADTQMTVYYNGILQREGGAYDYITSPATDTITFNTAVPAGNTITIITVENIAAQAVTGLMMESRFTDLGTGLIRLDRVGIPDGALPQAKVAGLIAALGNVSRITQSPTPPIGPDATDLWLDSSSTPNLLKVYDGVQWLLASPDSVLPGFTASQAGGVLHVNGTGTGLEFRAVDLSTVIPKSSRGAANGVATLDSSARLPSAQLPEVLGTDSYFYGPSGAVSNGTKTVTRIYGQQVRLTGVSVALTGGTCSVQLAVNGVATGPTISVSSTVNEVNLGSPIEVDATSTAVSIGLIVGAASSATGIEASIAVKVIAT